MTQENHSRRIHPLVSGAAKAGLAMTISSLPAVASAQQATDTAPASSDDSTTLKPIVVTGQNAANTNSAKTGISRLPATVKETPKVINVVPAEIIEQQRATTLEQILKNVPGITMSTGEGNGGQSGDQFRIRGLTAKGDIYVDGLRDFGAYKRDAFNTESVEVIKGPSGESFGVGNVGGLINQSSKKARLGTSTSIDQGIGSASTYRTTVDSNIQVNDTTAIRFNGMFQDGNVADRDHVEDDRRGVAVDVGMGLGTDTEWHLNYSYLHRDTTPDYGVPMAQGADGIYRPLTEYDVPGIDSSTSYIRSTDRDISDTHMFTSNFAKELDSGITITNDTRLGIYKREFSATNPAAISAANLQRLLNGTNVALTYGAGGGMAYEQEGWAIQNVLAAKGEFDTGALRHRTMIGLDLNYQEDNRDLGVWTGRVNNQTVVDPTYAMTSGASLAFTGASRDATAQNVGLFASDRMWLTDQVSLQGSLRWDYFRSEYETDASTVGGAAESRELSPAISAIWEPTKDAMLYASFARTYRPIGTDIAVAVGGVASEVPSDGVGNEPERSDTFEIGGKLDLFDGRLGLTGAIFQIDKDNAYTVDPVTGEITAGFSDNGEARRIRGVELGVNGEIMQDWTANIAYAYLDGEVTYSSTAANIGNEAPGVAHHNVSFWTSYTLPENLVQLPGRFSIGGGAQYSSSYWSDSANTAKMPENFSLDAMVGYKQDNFRVSFNAYNITDHLNYQSTFNAVRAVPASRRTFMVNIGTTF